MRSFRSLYLFVAGIAIFASLAALHSHSGITCYIALKPHESKTPNSSVTNLPSPLTNPSSCAWQFVGYFPSEWEQHWVENVKKLQTRVCEESNKDLGRISAWVDVASANMERPTSPLSVEVFSRFVFQNNCTEDFSYDFIEPLSGLTRHPYFCLKGEEWVVNKDYLIISWNLSKKLTAWNVYTPKAYYFDLGASDWDSGAGGASQSWIVSTYEKRGVEWDGIFCWEAVPMNASQVWEKIPPHLKPIYHWYNIPVSPVENHGDDVLTYIQKLVRREDFVLVKIDIDNSMVESQIISRLLRSEQLLGLVDELFFEHHVNVAPMHGYWGTQQEKETLMDTYRIFSELRHKGILAHSWV